MNLGTLRRLQETYTSFGAVAVLHVIACRVVEKLARGEIYRLFTLEYADIPEKLKGLPSGFTLTKMSGAEAIAASTPALRFADVHDPTYDPGPDLDPGTRCYGLLEGDLLVCRGWYRSASVLLDPSVSISFDPGWMYSYRSFTVPTHRRRGLAAQLEAQASLDFKSQGCQGILGIIYLDNFPSIQSGYKVGYRAVGTLVVLRIFGATRVFTTPGCRRTGLTVQQNARRTTPLAPGI